MGEKLLAFLKISSVILARLLPPSTVKSAMERPRVLINFAISADGKIGAVDGGASRFTSRADFERLLDIRERADGILVGRGTLEADSMSMTIPKDRNPQKQPLRCIVSRSGEFNSEHKVFHSAGGPIHLVVTGKTKASEETFPHKKNVFWHSCSLETFLHRAKSDLNMDNLLCEGGGMLAAALFELDVIDEINLTIAAHSLIGGRLAPTITGLPEDFLSASRGFQLETYETTPDDEIFARWTRAEIPIST